MGEVSNFPSELSVCVNLVLDGDSFYKLDRSTEVVVIENNKSRDQRRVLAHDPSAEI